MKNEELRQERSTVGRGGNPGRAAGQRWLSAGGSYLERAGRRRLTARGSHPGLPRIALPGLFISFPWTIAVLAGLCLAAACIPGSAEALQYDRGRVMHGEVWRLLTGQLVHWSARMAWADLGVLLGLGAWLEVRGERPGFALGLGALLTALAVHALSPDLLVYRGSSGLASALFVRAAARVARSTERAPRRLALCAVALFLAKAAWETATGDALFAGSLAPGVRVVPLVHLLGGVAGVFTLEKGGGPDGSPVPRGRSFTAGF